MISKLPRFPGVLLCFAITVAVGKLPICIVIPALADEVDLPRAADKPPKSDGDRLVADAARRIRTHASVRALIHAEVSLWDHAFLGKGLYLATRSEGNFLSRLELQLDSRRVADAITDAVQSKLLDVNDGRYLWRERQWNDSRKVERVDLARVRPAPGEESLPKPWAKDSLTLNGGLEPLLESLGENFDFGKVVASRIDRVPVLRTIGQWKPDRLAALIADDKQAESKKPPSHLPREVSLTLGRDDLFPYEVDFRAGDSAQKGQDPPAALRYRFYEVVLDAAIDPRFYVYKPGDVLVEDRTDDYLKQAE